MQKIKLGISSCLLGYNVRYDGGHKLDHYLRDTLGKFIEWVNVCPEVECGLSIPRESMRLIGDSENPRLITHNSKIDYTDKMNSWAKKRINLLKNEDICGFIFKSKSPSSGLFNVKIYNENGMPTKKGSGLFAKAFVNQFPLKPVEEEGRLHDPLIRENFIERIFVYYRWKNTKKNPNEIINFHSDHKYTLMAHSPKYLKELGFMVANMKKKESSNFYNEYFSKMTAALKTLKTVKKNVNVLMHITGYFKKYLSNNEKEELIEIIMNYHKMIIPIIVPLTLIKHYAKKYNIEYLKRQTFLNAHPLELMLLNHV